MSVASATNPRIDTVVLRLNDNFDVRSCTFDIVQGEEASTPVAPALTRDSTIWEIGLANIYKPAVVSALSPIVVMDTRLDPERCGIISSVSEFDTSTLYNQIRDDLAYFKGVSEADFTEWFENLRVQLSGDVASNLQDQIGALSLLLATNKNSLVDAINEIFSTNTPSTLSRILHVVASQSLSGNPIPTSWQSVIAGMKYQSNGYVVTASVYNDGGEAFKTFDDNSSTYWEGNVIAGASLMVEFPSAILVDKMYLMHTAPPASVLTIEYSHNGYEWFADTTLTSSTTNGLEVKLTGNTAKYWRLNFSAAGNTTVKVFEWSLSDYTVTTYEASFTLSRMPSMVAGQTILVQTDINHNATGVVANTLNELPIHSILQADKIYELTFHLTHYTAKEVG